MMTSSNPISKTWQRVKARNHEHIALLGLCLSSPSSEAHKIARHLADYVLVWAGGGGKDDVGKSKHMARIANSVSGWWFGTFFIFPYIGNNHPK